MWFAPYSQLSPQNGNVKLCEMISDDATAPAESGQGRTFILASYRTAQRSGTDP